MAINDVREERQTKTERDQSIAQVPTPVASSDRERLHQLLDSGDAEKHYQIGEYIGHGAFSKVYHGKIIGDKGQVKTAAIKVVQLGENDKNIKYVIQELEAMKRIKHKNVVKLISARMTTDGKTLYIATRLEPGFELYLWIRDHATQLREKVSTQDGSKPGEMPAILPLSKVKFAARRLYFALQAIHKARISHNDLDTSNIKIGNPNGPKNPRFTIMDLNLSGMDDNVTTRDKESDIIRLTMVILELGMKPQPKETPRHLFGLSNDETFGGALISIPRWNGDSEVIARYVLKMSQDPSTSAIEAYPEVLDFVGHVLRLSDERQLTFRKMFKHSLLKRNRKLKK